MPMVSTREEIMTALHTLLTVARNKPHRLRTVPFPVFKHAMSLQNLTKTLSKNFCKYYDK
jgi:hypothetical protein